MTFLQIIKSVRASSYLFRSASFIQKRTLYAPSTLGVDGYIKSREKTKQQFANNEVKFIEKMKEFVENENNLIFTEDLRNMLHLTNKDNVDLVMKMIEKYNSQSKDVRYGNYIFGPVVMRMFYHLGDTDMALKVIKDPKYEEFFNQPMSYQILMDMLFEEQKYQEILEIYDTIKSRDVANAVSSKHLVTLVTAACYKLNNSESLEKSLKILEECNKKNLYPMRKAVTFVAGLALKQNSPHISLELIGTVKDQQYLTVRNIKAKAYADINRPEDALLILRSTLEIDEPIPPNVTKRTFIKDVIESVEDSIKRNHKVDLENDFKRIVKFLNDNGYITEQSLDEILCLEITSTNYNGVKRNQQSYLTATFSKNNYKDNYRLRNQNRRQSLQDLY